MSGYSKTSTITVDAPINDKVDTNNLVSNNNRNLSENTENPKRGVKDIFNILGLGLLGFGSLFVIKKEKQIKITVDYTTVIFILY